MRRTSIYLDDIHVERLRRIAEAEGRTQAEVVRDAIPRYERQERLPRFFAMDEIAKGPGGSIADIPEEELLKGFGEN